LWLIGLGIFALLLAACGPAPTPAVVEKRVEVTKVVEKVVEKPVQVTKVVEIEKVVTPTPTPGEPVTLKMWIMPNGPDPLGAIQEEIEAFEKTHPNIHIEVEVLDWGAAWPKITTAATSGEGPDISQLGTTWVAAIAAMGALRPFTAEEIAAMGGAENFVEASWQTCNPVGSGFTVAIPWFVDTRAIIYREDVLEKVGLDPGEAFATWDSFDAALARIKEADLGIAPIGFPGKNDWNVLHNFAPWVWGAGGEMLNPGNTAAVFNSPEAIAGFKFYASLFTKGYTQPDVLELNSAQVDGRFSSGEVAMVISGPWMVKGSRTPTDQGGWSESEAAQFLAVHEIPAGPAGRYTFVGGSNLTVWNASQHQKEAVEFVKFLVSRESQIRYNLNIGMLPAVKAALADPAFKDDPDYGVFVQAVENGKSYPAIAAWGPLESAMVKNLGALWDDVAGVNGPFDPDTMIPARLNAAKQEVDALLAAGGAQ
jgi:multiple sugar transport system substrate-binding protein